MTLILLIAFLALFPLVSQADDMVGSVVDGLGGLHPAVLPAMGIIWGIMKVADIFISEDKKAKWPGWFRKGWDSFLLHIGKSRNAGSPDA